MQDLASIEHKTVIIFVILSQICLTEFIQLVPDYSFEFEFDHLDEPGSNGNYYNWPNYWGLNARDKIHQATEEQVLFIN